MNPASYIRSNFPQLWEQVMRSLDIQGPLPDAVEPAVQPGVTLLDMTAPEYLWLRRTRRFIHGTSFGPVAGQFSRVEFTLTQPGTIVTLDLLILNPNAGTVNYGVEQVFAQTAGLASTTREQNADVRQPSNTATGAALPVLDVRTGNLAAVAPTANAVLVSVAPGAAVRFPTLILDPDLPVTGLGPGGQAIFALVPGAANTACAFLAEWTERVKSPQEA